MGYLEEGQWPDGDTLARRLIFGVRRPVAAFISLVAEVLPSETRLTCHRDQSGDRSPHSKGFTPLMRFTSNSNTMIPHDTKAGWRKQNHTRGRQTGMRSRRPQTF